MPSKSPVILVDGSSYLYRAFHALPPLTTSRGQPTGAIKGVANMLRRLVADHEPEYMAVVFDAKGKTFRDDLYSEYKANRPPMPDDMRSQIEPLHALVRALGLPLLVVPGVEADDVIGTLALQAVQAGERALVSTGDKDMAQLVQPGVTLVNTMTDTLLDDEAVMVKFGVRPDQIVDFLALVGDTSDNIPGVPGCGPKTAAKWLAEYDTLDAVIAHADKIKGKIGEKLRAALDTLPLSKDLATIRTELALDTTIESLRLQTMDNHTLAALYEELEFNAWQREIAEGRTPSGFAPVMPTSASTSSTAGSRAAAASPKPGRKTVYVSDDDGAVKLDDELRKTLAEAKPNYETITTEKALKQWITRLNKAEVFAFDTETTSLAYMQADVVGVSFAVEPGKAAYVPLAHDYDGAPGQLDRDRVFELLQPVLQREPHNLVGQHIKYDLNVLRRHGIELGNIAHDTMLQSYVIDSVATRHDLDSLAQKYLGLETVRYEDIAGKGSKQLSFDAIDIEKAAHYAAEDADITLRLHLLLWPALKAVPKLRALYEDVEMPLLRVLSRMECTGVRIDSAKLAEQSAVLSERLEVVAAEAYDEAGHEFNLGSPTQLQQVLFEEQQLPVVRKTPKGQPSTAEDVLETLALEHALPRMILEHRSLAKLKSTYTDKLPKQVDALTGRVHTSYHQAVAATGRLSSTDPNLQNIPIRTEAGRRIREAFIPREGHRLLAADYSQIELRIMAHLSSDESLLKAFAEGLDVHRATAAEVFAVTPDAVNDDQRRAAKAINFGLIYGMSAFGLAKQLGITRGQASDYIALYFARYPGVKRYMDETRMQAKERGFVETVFGRRLYLPDINARNARLRNYAERTAINAPMQGTAADIIKRAMITVDDWLAREKVNARVIMQVHDELVLEVKSGQADTVATGVVKHMEGAAKLAVPLVVETGVGNSWEEAH